MLAPTLAPPTLAPPPTLPPAPPVPRRPVSGSTGQLLADLRRKLDAALGPSTPTPIAPAPGLTPPAAPSSTPAHAPAGAATDAAIDAHVVLRTTYRLPEHGGVTFGELLGRVDALRGAGVVTASRWLEEDGHLVGLEITATRPLDDPEARLDRYRDVLGADVAHAAAEWEAP